MFIIPALPDRMPAFVRYTCFISTNNISNRRGAPTPIPAVFGDCGNVRNCTCTPSSQYWLLLIRARLYRCSNAPASAFRFRFGKCAAAVILTVKPVLLRQLT